MPNSGSQPPGREPWVDRRTAQRQPPDGRYKRLTDYPDRQTYEAAVRQLPEGWGSAGLSNGAKQFGNTSWMMLGMAVVAFLLLGQSVFMMRMWGELVENRRADARQAEVTREWSAAQAELTRQADREGRADAKAERAEFGAMLREQRAALADQRADLGAATRAIIDLTAEMRRTRGAAERTEKAVEKATQPPPGPEQDDGCGDPDPAALPRPRPFPPKLVPPGTRRD